VESRWHHSRLFWFGLPGFLFLIWIWWAYLRTPQSISWGTKKAEYCFGWGDSDVGFVVNKYEFYIGLEGSPELGFYTREEPLYPEDETIILKPALYLYKGRVGIKVAQWSVVAVYVILWVGSLAAWQQRKRRLMRPFEIERGG
jgi:hypothetical protein